MTGGTAGLVVGEATAEATYPLRRDVLRAGRPGSWPVDPPGTLHLAARTADGRVVGVVRFVPAACPYRPRARASWQLRGMATDPSVRGSGVGRAVVRLGLARVTGRGADVVWCDARASAAGFYARMGFTAVTGPFDRPATGPHVGMVVDIGRVPTPSGWALGSAGTEPRMR
ncbi:GNAT family N-acetyltransferase [Blastococcus goldschmidtiae]|uniref:GNAT family N-acetyltransferase n=1 Tax=Blastococcus goldschmidtiae TaxID=3075546 RepID=A0ABU2K669_9ACTN|nr:GNAT family N-acetyltransferase [Blastococcus sp. DSM 46792]MDT0275689.1 GNAT family N-acetyltransferase [Blastococcus sp. DSM 46792]